MPEPIAGFDVHNKKDKVVFEDTFLCGYVELTADEALAIGYRYLVAAGKARDYQLANPSTAFIVNNAQQAIQSRSSNWA